MALEKQLKWEGKASAELKVTRTCHGVEGTPGVAGCVWLCDGFKTPVDPKSDQNQDQEKANRTKQKLLSIDPAEMTYSYSIIDGNVGFNSYLSTVQVVPKDAECTIVWKYEVEPVEG
ncbi:hypothetical protein FF1_026344 [Malus domestica]